LNQSQITYNPYCPICKKNIPLDELGIYSEEEYYHDHWEGTDHQTPGKTIQFDWNIILSGASNRMIKKYPRILLAGAASWVSIREFYYHLPVPVSCELIVIEKSPAGISKIKETWNKSPFRTQKIRIVQDDLKTFSVAEDEKFGYIRMDYTLGCMSRNQVVSVLSNLKRALSPGGCIGNVIDMNDDPDQQVRHSSGQHSIPFAQKEIQSMYKQAGLIVKSAFPVESWDHDYNDQYDYQWPHWEMKKTGAFHCLIPEKEGKRNKNERHS
jgi:SAM-dependent methyltransferase